MSCNDLAGIAAQFVPAKVRRVTYRPWLDMWVPHVVLAYPQWELKEILYEAPVLGQLAWLVGGSLSCAGCGSRVDISALPALAALCPRCYNQVPHESWACCEKVTNGQWIPCGELLQVASCNHQDPDPKISRFAGTPACLEGHELVAMWFAPGRARACILPSSQAGAAIAASGALVVRRYHPTGRLTFLEDWVAVLEHLRASPPPIQVIFRSTPSHQEISEESSEALAFFADRKPSAIESARELSRRELFDPIEVILRANYSVVIEETWAQCRYFLPRRLPRRDATPTSSSSGAPVSLLGTGVGAWGPWMFLRRLDGTVARLNFASLLGRLVTDSPLLFPEDVVSPQSTLDAEEIDLGSTSSVSRLVPPDPQFAGADPLSDSEGGD